MKRWSPGTGLRQSGQCGPWGEESGRRGGWKERIEEGGELRGELEPEELRWRLGCLKRLGDDGLLRE